jgi:hypothetical protein
MNSRGAEVTFGRRRDRSLASRLAGNCGLIGGWCADGLLNWRKHVTRNIRLGDHDEVRSLTGFSSLQSCLGSSRSDALPSHGVRPPDEVDHGPMIIGCGAPARRVFNPV